MKNNFIRFARIAAKTALAAVTLLTFAQCNGVKVDGTTVEVYMPDSMRRVFDFYGDDIVRVFQDPQGGELCDPVATPHAQILVENPRRTVTNLTIKESSGKTVMTTPRIKVVVDKATGLMTVTDRTTKKVVFEETTPATIKDGMATMTVKAESEEAYVRMIVTITKAAELKAIFGDDFLPENYVEGWDKAVWVPVAMTEDTVNNAFEIEFRYHETVDASESTDDIVLEPLFEKFTLPGEVNGEQLKTIADMQIKAEGHAIQAVALQDADAAWAAFEAQIDTANP